MRNKCNNCGKSYDSSIKGSIKKYCSKSCGRKDYYLKNKEKENKNAASWYLKNRDSELESNREYRRQNRELFNWYHDKNRFGGMREIILGRDKYECRGCASENMLIIHHKDGTGETSLKKIRKDEIEINNDIKNLITLCSSCHTKLHFWQKRNNIILEDDKEIINLLKNLL